MRTIVVEIEDKVDELLVVLDRDIQYIQENMLRLDKLRGLVVKRDDAALEKLLASIESGSDSYRSNELKRKSLREELAIALDCNPEKMTLSRLEAELTGEKKAQVARRKALLRSLAEELKKKHLRTALLLSDCARFNSKLLRSVFELGKTGTVTYSSKGSKRRQTDTAFVNLRF